MVRGPTTVQPNGVHCTNLSEDHEQRIDSLASPIRFHVWHGENIVLLNNGAVANRSTSFAHGIAFSDRPLLPTELFVVEIEKVENGWNGHMRLGLTVVNPNSQPNLPRYALPDLNGTGQSWIYAITRTLFTVYDGINGEINVPNFQGSSTSAYMTPYLANESQRSVAQETRNRLCRHTPGGRMRSKTVLPTDVGSRIGCFYKVTSELAASMYFIVNGVEHGPVAVDIPLNSGPIFALVDVYGTTKQIRILPSYHSIHSLQQLCQRCIVAHTAPGAIDMLPLPQYLKRYLENGIGESDSDENCKVAFINRILQSD